MTLSKKEAKKVFLTALISACLLLSLLHAGVVTSAAHNEEELVILVYRDGMDLEGIQTDVIADYGGYLLTRVSPEDWYGLKMQGYRTEILEQVHYVALNDHSFDTTQGPPSIPDELRVTRYPRGVPSPYIVQFVGPVMREWQEELMDMGVTLHEFRHGFNFIVEMDPETAGRVERLDHVNWVGIYQPAYKFDNTLMDVDGTVCLDVYLFHQEYVSMVAKTVVSMGGEVNAISGTRLNIDISGEDIGLLANMPFVKSMAPGTNEYSLFNSKATWVTQTNQENNRKVTDQGVIGLGELITVMDSELFVEHEAFADPDGNPIGDTHRKIQAWYVPEGAGGDLDAGVFHGTHVTGSVLGNSPPYDSYSNHDGNAMGARVIFQDVSRGPLGGVFPPEDMYNYAWGEPYAWGSRVQTNSWGGGAGYSGIAIEADEFIWDHKDFNIVFAAGNSGPDAYTISQQGEGKNVITVGAVTGGAGGTRGNDIVPNFSSRGYAQDGRIKPTVLHVGSGLMSSGEAGGEPATDSYSSMSGTSMATPGIAGQAGQVRHYYSGGWYPSGTENPGDSFNPSNALVRATLINGAVEISGNGAYENDERFPNNDQGYGRSMLDRVLYFAGDSRNTQVFDSYLHGVELGTGESWDMYFDVDDPSQELEVTLAWSDHPGSAGADETNPAIVNDLDLVLTAPDGTRYVGNAFTGFNPGYSEPNPTDNHWSGLRTGEYDGLNVEENILLLPDQNGVQAGSYQLTVTAFNVPQGTQPFAVVVSGGISPDLTPRPSIDITRPTGGETWHVGSQESIEWDTTIGEAPIDHIDLEFSTDGGTTWTPIESGLDDTGSYMWTVIGESTHQAMIRATVRDTGGMTGMDTSPLFSIEAVMPLPPSNPQPPDGSTGVELDPELSVHVEHEGGLNMDVRFYDSDDNLIGTDTNVGSGTRASVTWSGLTIGTTYQWYAEAYDGDNAVQSPVWSFTTLDEYTLNIAVDGEGSTDPPPGTHTYSEGEQVTITATPSQGWHFAGWTGDHTGAQEEITITMDSDKSVTANFGINEYDLIINIQGEGSTDPPSGSHTYEHGDTVTVTATSASGWYFSEWTGDHVGTQDEITFTMDGHKTVTAVFLEYRTLTVSIEGQGTTDPSPGTYTYSQDEQVTVTATPSQGWYFAGWTGDHVGTEDEITITMDVDKTVTANFLEYAPPFFQVSITSHDGEVLEGSDVHLEFTVTNTGELEGTQDILFTVDGTVLDEVPMTLAPGGSETGTFSWTAATEGVYTLAVSSDDHSDSVSVTVDTLPTDRPYFSVEILGDYDGVVEGDTVTVTYRVTNTGGAEGTQDIIFTVNEILEGTHTGISLDVDGEHSDTFTWTPLEEGEFTIQVSSDDHSDSRTVTVGPLPDDPLFRIEITDHDSAVKEGEEVSVSYRVWNAGGAEGTQDIVFTVNDAQEDAHTGINLGPGDDHTGTFSWTAGSPGSYSFEISSDDRSASVTVIVEEDEEPVEPDPDDPEEPAEEGFLQRFWWLILLILIVLVLIILLSKRRSKEESVPEEEEILDEKDFFEDETEDDEDLTLFDDELDEEDLRLFEDPDMEE